MSYTILVAEDDQAMRNVLGGILRGAGYRVLEVEDGIEALDLFRLEAPEIDVLIANIGMPRMGGLELARIMTQQKPGLGVLFVSADPKPEFALLRKPFSATELLGHIERLTAKSDAAESGS